MSHHRRLPAWASGTAMWGGVLLVFFAVPVRVSGPGEMGLAVLVTLAGVGVISVVIAQEVGAVSGRREPGSLRLIHVVLLLEIAVLAFALTYYSIAEHRPDEFHGMHTRLDALYFTVTTTTTVGFGDINAAGQLSRALVVVQIAFNVVFLAAASRLVSSKLEELRHR